MIIEQGEKTKVLYKDGNRVYAVFDGSDLVYNCYAVISSQTITISKDGDRTEDVKSNTSWVFKF